MYTAIKFVHVGMGNVVCANRVLVLIKPNTACGKRYLKEAKRQGTYIDACLGRPLKSIILLDDGRVVGSAISPRTLGDRFNNIEGSDQNILNDDDDYEEDET